MVRNINRALQRKIENSNNERKVLGNYPINKSRPRPRLIFLENQPPTIINHHHWNHWYNNFRHDPQSQRLRRKCHFRIIFIKAAAFDPILIDSVTSDITIPPPVVWDHLLEHFTARTSRDQELRWWHPFSLHNQIPSQHQIFVISLSFRYKNVRDIPVLVVVLWRCLYTGTGQTLRHSEEEEEEERDIKNNSIKISRYYLQAAVDHWVGVRGIVVNKQNIRRSSVLLMSVYTRFL